MKYIEILMGDTYCSGWWVVNEWLEKEQGIEVNYGGGASQIRQYAEVLRWFGYWG